MKSKIIGNRTILALVAYVLIEIGQAKGWLPEGEVDEAGLAALLDQLALVLAGIFAALKGKRIEAGLADRRWS